MASDIEEGEVVDIDDAADSVMNKPQNYSAIRDVKQGQAVANQPISQGWSRAKPAVDFDSDSSAGDDEDSGSAFRMNKQRTAKKDPRQNVRCSCCNLFPCQCSNSHALENTQTVQPDDRRKAVPKRRVNNIWGSMLQEEQLENTIKKVGVEETQLFTKKSDRGAESYAYTKALECKRSVTTEQFDNEINNDYLARNNEPGLEQREMFGREVKQTKKRKNSDSAESEDHETGGERKWKRGRRRLNNSEVRSVKDRLGPRMAVDSIEQRSEAVTATSSAEDVISEIMRVLREPKDKIELFEAIVEQVGSECALEVLAMTQDVEASGGMWTFDQSRRRTPGGVYIQLLKKDSRLTPDKMKVVFGEEQRKFRENSKNRLKEERRRKLEQKKRALKGFVCSDQGQQVGSVIVHQQELLQTDSNSYDAFDDDDDLGASSPGIELTDC